MSQVIKPETHITVTPDMAARRLDVVLAEVITDTSRAQLQRRIALGEILVDGAEVTAKYLLSVGQLIEITPVVVAATVAQPIPTIQILKETDDMLFINKPAGLVVHLSESGRPQPTVAAFAAAHGVIDDDPDRPGIVHRLDKDTSGVMVLAKNLEAKAWLQAQFKARTVQKSYIVLVRGRLEQAEAIIKLPIGRDRKQPLRRAVTPGAREAITHYRVLEDLPGASLLEVDLHTGRTHQIRVHFSHLGHPVVGDSLYGDTTPERTLQRQFLHASSLSLKQPDGTLLTVTASLPPDLQVYLDSLRANA